MQVIICLFLCIFGCVFANPSYRNADAMLGCHCVERNMCQDNDVAAISGGKGLFDIRHMQRALTKVCDNPNEVCCENILSSLQPSSTERCGIPSILTYSNRITANSKTAQFGEVPWTVIVLENNFVVSKFISRCGGSLIHPQVVMTVAHCVNDPGISHWLIRAGEWNTHNTDEPLPHQDRTVREVFVHPFFDANFLINDVALMILEKPVELADNVRLVCLPPPEIHVEQVNCLVSGWGKENFQNGKYSPILKLIDLPLVEHQDCERALRRAKFGQLFHLHKSFLCAGGEQNKDACKGDGGSPLVCPVPGQPGRYVQLGIVAWGVGCGENNTPGVYVNVPQIRNWVDEQLTRLDFDIGTYQYD